MPQAASLWYKVAVLALQCRHRTALHISVACGSVKLASLLLSARASLDALDEDTQGRRSRIHTWLSSACKDGRSAMDIAQPGFFDSVEAASPATGAMPWFSKGLQD